MKTITVDETNVMPIAVAMICSAMAQGDKEFINDEANAWLIDPLLDAIEMMLLFIPEQLGDDMAQNIVAGRLH